MSQVDSNVHRSQLLDFMTNVRCDDWAISKDDGYNMTKQGQPKRRETTVGYNFEIKRKNGTE